MSCQDIAMSFALLGTHCLEAQPAPNDTGLVVSGWDGEVIDFNSHITYKCFRGMKFKDDFDQEMVQAVCLPENKWSFPDWGQCIESKHLKVNVVHEFGHLEFLFPAKYCSLPPSPPENGTVEIKHSGLKFGSVCPGANGAEDLPMTGCQEHGMKINFKSTLPQASKVQQSYEILVNNVESGTTFVFLLVFTQPVSPADLIIASSEVTVIY